MPQYKNKRTGVVISVEDGVTMLSVWQPVDLPELPVTTEMQTFDTVVNLKKSADKDLPARTTRGSVYEYSKTESEWRKTEG